MRTLTIKLQLLENGEFVKDTARINLSELEFENFCRNAAKNSPPCGPLDFLRQIIRRFSSKEGGETARDEEIALALLKFILREKGVRLGDSLKRDLGNIAKETKIPLDELKEFGKRRAAELVQETFGK